MSESLTKIISQRIEHCDRVATSARFRTSILLYTRQASEKYINKVMTISRLKNHSDTGK